MEFCLIYNNLSGRNKARKIALKVKSELERLFFRVSVFDIQHKKDALEHVEQATKNDLNRPVNVVVFGGDGTVSSVVTQFKNCLQKVCFSVYPCGTANDFAIEHKFPKNIKKFTKILISQKLKSIDLIDANGKIVVHAVGAGHFTNGSANFNAKRKKIFGRFAYYFKCAMLTLKLNSARLKIEFDKKETLTDNFLFYYVINTKLAGGFKRFSKGTVYDDGIVEFVGVKKCGFFSFLWLVLKIFLGCSQNCKQIIRRKSSNINVEVLSENKEFENLDLDGECEGQHPLNIKVLNKKMLLKDTKK